MTYDEILARAREVMGPNCRVCPDCNGVACRGQVPGLGGMGSGSSFTVCREYLKRVKIMMDVVYEPTEQDTSIELFGRRFDFPFFLAPIGGMKGNYNGYLTESEWSDICVGTMAELGSLAFTPDGPVDKMYYIHLDHIKKAGGLGVPTIKPWDTDKLLERIRDAEDAGAIAVSCDIDSCNHPNMKREGFKLQPMSPEVMRHIVESTPLPFIPKGVMTAKAAVRCAEAGCYGIVVSTHGGRVVEDAPAPCSMLPEIRAAVGDSIKIFVDGGIRSGIDVFKCLALGADAVLIGRPYVVAAHGGGREGLRVYTEKLLGELKDMMLITGCSALGDIDADKIRIE